MFGISSLGWIHTLGSLPAIPAAIFMFTRYGRIVPRSTPGAIYFVSMLIGAATVFLVAHQPISYVVGVLTILFLVISVAGFFVTSGWLIFLYTQLIVLWLIIYGVIVTGAVFGGGIFLFLHKRQVLEHL